MSQTNDLLTIREYATIRGCSPQAVRNRLTGTLRDFVVTVDGKQFLDRKVLEAEGLTTPLPTLDNNPLPTLDNPPKTPPQDTPQSSQMDRVIAALERQLLEKDKQIERLQTEAEEMRHAAAEKDRFIQEQAGRLSLLLEQSQELQRNNQLLLGVAQGMTPKAAEPTDIEQEQDSEIIAATPPQAAAEAETPPPQADIIQEEKAADSPATASEKKSFWRRLFGGK